MTTETNRSIELTDAAMSRIRKVMSNGDDLQSKFRVYVTGGGCSGFQYGFKFDNEEAFDDDIIKVWRLLCSFRFNVLSLFVWLNARL
jgi:iron-sulfur cluster insertion protein